MLLQASDVDRHDGDLGEAGSREGLAHQRYIVGRTAAAAGLHVDDGHLVDVVFAALQRVDKLSDDADRWIAGVVVDVLYTAVHRLAAFVLQQFHVVAVLAEHFLEQAEMHRQHRGRQQRVGLLHLLRKDDPVIRRFDLPLFGLDIFFVVFAAAAAFQTAAFAARTTYFHFASLSSRAPTRLRSRIFAAPRLLISSILICVYSLP